MRNIFALVLLSGLMAACNSTVSDFVDAGEQRQPDSSDQPSTTPPAPSASSPGLKISPGAVTSIGVTVKSKASITPTRRRAQGSQLETEFTLHQTRTN